MTGIKKRVLSALLALALVLSLAPEALAAAATATTVQLTKKEGTVAVSNSSGRKLSIIDKMRLYNGYHVTTEEKSYAWINLDGSKLGKLDAVSKLEVRKSGKKLEMLLNEGNLFFNITEPLEEDESLNIRTSSMIVGIRGTCGWAEVTDQWTAEIYALEGTVAVSVTDPVTGETEADTISGGEKLICRVSPSGSKPTATSNKYAAEDIGGFVLMELKDDMALRQKITQESGLDLVNWTVDPEQRLKADQDEIQQKLAQIRLQERRQADNVSKYNIPAPFQETNGGTSEDGSVSWSYDRNTKTLRISGTGSMKALSYYSLSEHRQVRAWQDQYISDNDIETVIIEPGITDVPDHAFNSMHSITSVSIPNTVTYIGVQAFCATSLTSVTIPGSVREIHSIAFQSCDNLESVTIPEGVELIIDIFSYCDNLRSISIPSTATRVTNGTFLMNRLLTDVYFNGTKARWNQIVTGDRNQNLSQIQAITVHCTDGDIILPAYEGARTISEDGRTISTTSNAAPSSGYSDVPSDAWYAEAVAYCRKNNLMSGTSDTKFSPNEPLTRAMIVTVLHRLAGSPAASGKASLSDVQSGKWYTEAISWANSKGIVQGYPNGSFGINDPVTHGQVSLIFQRYSGDSNLRTIGAETPKLPATRAEIAATLMAYAEGQMESLAPGELSTFSAMDEMCAPSGIAADEDGSLLVTDLYGKQVRRVTNRYSGSCAGGTTVKDLYGQPVGGYNDAGVNTSYFKAPWGIAPYLDGWAVSDAENNAVRLILKDGVKTLPIDQKLDHPTGLASDGDGNLYISDTFSGTVYKLTSGGELSAAASGLTDPMGLCWKNGVLYIAETGANRIVKLQNGQVTTVAGSGEAALTDGRASEAAFDSPQGIAVADDGTIYVADTCNSAIRQIKNGTVTTLYARDIAQTASGLTSPAGLLLQGDRLLICDSFARKIFSIWLK